VSANIICKYVRAAASSLFDQENAPHCRDYRPNDVVGMRQAAAKWTVVSKL
jgi:hypothetical protein